MVQARLHKLWCLLVLLSAMLESGPSHPKTLAKPVEEDELHDALDQVRLSMMPLYPFG